MPKRKEALAEFNRSNIIKAAETLFLSKGVKETTVDDIAREADYSKATLYVYFKSKEEIYDSILLKSMTLLANQLQSAIDSMPDFERQYYAICDVFLDYAREFPFYFESILGTINCENETLYAAGEQLNEIIGAAMTKGMRDGFLRSGLQFPQIIMVMWASLSGVVRMSVAKERYVGGMVGGDALKFAKYGFDTLLECIKK